jgi:hypothetical protein
MNDKEWQLEKGEGAVLWVPGMPSVRTSCMASATVVQNSK